MIEKVERKAQIARSYKVRQPIENFKIRVKIMQQKSLLADLFENETDVGDTNFLEREERTFNWQEKVLGPAEVKFYAEEKNCITQSQLDYRRDILQGNVEDSRLYSYIDEDGCYPEKDLLVGSRSVTKLSKRNQEALPCQRNRKPFIQRYNRAVIDEFPNKERIRTNHYLYKELEVMHLVVDLTSKNEESSIVNEALLCTVTFDRVAKTLTVNPDFTTEEEPYGIESSEMNYDYWIFHDSQGQTQEELQNEVATLQREMQKLQLYKNAEKFKEMKVPESGTVKYFINLEILSAKNFAYDYLFVNYVVSLPQNWEAAREEALLGRTQRCIKKDGKAYFSYVSEIVLNYNKNTDEISTPSWPQLFLSVASLDKWTRYRIEGYGSMFLPSDPGSHKVTVHTWRPAGDFINLLRRFFTGGTYELEDINYCGIPQNHQDICLEKSNLETVPSGSVKIKLNVVQQTLENEEDLRSELQRNNNNRGSNPEQVLAQFRAARERMIQTKNIRSE